MLSQIFCAARLGFNPFSYCLYIKVVMEKIWKVKD